MDFLELKPMRYFLLFTMICYQFSLISCQKLKEYGFSDSSFNKDWLFKKGDSENAAAVDFQDIDWRKLDVPHDWAIEGPFDPKYNARTGGLPVHGVAWYRKHFTVAKGYEGKRISVEFDGVMNNSKVYLNGEYIGERPFGYMGFELDLTPHIRFNEDNVIAVRVAPEDLASRWYSGAGIYRNVYLKINDPIHIPQWGTFITTPEVSDTKATINIETKLKNASGKSVSVTLETELVDNAGNTIATATDEIGLTRENAITQSIKIQNPKRWSLENPQMYRAISKVKLNDKLIDEYNSDFGIRTIAFDKEKGFMLNDEQVELNGVCMHHDLGPLGAAVNYRATERQMQIMQSMGVNALRTSHNPPSPEMLEVCDKLGIVVIVEAFDEWKIGKVPNGYNKVFDEWHERDLRDMIKRDRNHPSVIMWSIGNEILEQGREDGWKLAKHLNDICHDEDSTRPTTVGFNYYPAPFDHKLAYQVDIVGMNYWPENYNEILENNPNMIVYGSETSSQTSSRGVYHLPIEAEVNNSDNHVSSYDAIVGPPWAYPPDVEFDAQEKAPKSLGEFMWTGFDYLGEPTPFGGRDNSTNGYWNDDWPSRSSYFAPVDLSGFPKDRYYLYQSQWTKEPMVHLLPHWNWEGKEGDIIPVYAYSNAEEVELFLNGKSMGKRVKGKDVTEIPAEYHEFEKGIYKSIYRLNWNVPYQPGSLKAIAYIEGNEVASKEITTAGTPSQIELIADRSVLSADSNDLSFITVRILDKDRNICPLADNSVDFIIEGPGSIVAVGNGDQTSLQSFQASQRKAFNGKCLVVVKSLEDAGEIKVTAKSEALIDASLTLQTN